CEVEPFDRKISCYIACLETIANIEEGCRHERAQYLLDQYRKASIKGPKPDYKRARNWERECVYGSIYLHQPTFVDRNLSGTVNNRTIGTINKIVSGSSKREVQVPDNQNNIENSYDMRFYKDININEDIYVDEIHLSQE
ncbi:8547_t:CDS:2, partial [Dentiscutata erythropus]